MLNPNYSQQSFDTSGKFCQFRRAKFWQWGKTSKVESITEYVNVRSPQYNKLENYIEDAIVKW